MTYEQIVNAVKKALAKADASKIKNHVAVQVDIVGEGEGAFYVEVNDGTLAIEPYEYYDHDAKLIVSAENCVDFFSGKKALDATVEGNEESVAVLKTLIPAKKATAKKAAAKPAAKAPAKKAPAKKAEPAKKEAPKAPAKKAEPAKKEAPKAPAKKAEPVKKEAPKKAPAKKAEPAKKEAPKAPAKKAEPAKKEAPKKAPAKKTTKK